jgi:type I restriction enzyme R subunit
MDASIDDMELQREVMEVYGERYPAMSLNDWRHVIEAYTPMVREAAQPKAKEISMQQYGMAAEPEPEK